jgi:acetone carboxylase gamma subunit
LAVGSSLNKFIAARIADSYYRQLFACCVARPQRLSRSECGRGFCGYSSSLSLPARLNFEDADEYEKNG